MPEREISFEGVLNFRDLGGFAAGECRVRRGRLFRSMTPEWMTEADIERAHHELGIAVVVDLRGPDRESGPIAEPPARGVKVDFMCGMREERLPRPEGEVAETFFPWLLRCVGPELVQVIETLAEEREGAGLFHCETGKDRTGLVAALILGLLGVDDEEIVADYMQSAPYFEPMLEFLDTRGRPVPDRFWLAQEPPIEAGMRAMLRMINEEYGGARNFLLDAGASEEMLDSLVEQMLE